MSQTYDGTFTTAQQNGAKQVTLPLQSEGNYHATLVRRNYIAAPATAYAPVLGTLTNYTQRLKYSDDFSNAVWTKAQTTATASAATDPEGQTTASKLAEDNTNNVHTATQAMTVASGAIAFGILVKAAERTFVRLRINNGTDGNLAIAVFNLSTGVVLSGTGTIKRLLNGWFWCSVQGTATVANSSAIIDLTSDGSTFTYLGTTGSGVYLWRATAYLAASIGPAVATTSTTRSVTAYPIDADDPLAFLVMEQEPDVSMLEMGVARWNREYANVPAPVVTYSSIAITKPSAESLGVSLGTLTQYASSAAAGTNLGTAYSYGGALFGNNQVYVRKNATASLTYPTGGTFTLTYKTSTTAALAYNANATAIAAAINALADVVTDGLTCVAGGDLSGSGRFQITWTVGITTSPVTINAGSLTPTATSSYGFNIVNSTTVQLVNIGYILNVPSHGFGSSGSLLVNTSSADSAQSLLAYTNGWVAVDSNNVAVNQDRIAASTNKAAILTRSYTPGADRVRTKNTATFYLPGFTLGVNSPDEIPVPNPATSDGELLTLVANSATGYQTYDAEPLEYWRAPIYCQRIIEIDVDDL